MKAHLMHKDRDFDPDQELPPNAEALTQDLGLGAVLAAMAQEDDFLLGVAERALLCGSGNDVETIRYRQDILRDCIENAQLVKGIYALTVEVIDAEKKRYLGILGKYPGIILNRSVEVLGLFVRALRRLRGIADTEAAGFRSEGFQVLFAMLRRELDDDYFALLEQHLRRLRLKRGVLISAGLGEGNKGAGYVLCTQPDEDQGWMRRLLAEHPPSFSYRLPPRDENGDRALAELRDRGLNLVANALAQSTDHIQSFFVMLRTELAFYIGCMNLRDRLAGQGQPTVFPEPSAADGPRRLSFRGLYDVGMALSLGQRVVGNDADADGKELLIVTGANQGGKSTFLRSIGLAQIMMQGGLFAPAQAFAADIVDGVFTHYRREEDASMRSGKLDEELVRMSAIIDQLGARPMLLFNESFSATNEREGAEIARQIVTALIERHVKVLFVSHQYAFSGGFHHQHLPQAIFFRAERREDGTRSFKLVEGAPLRTSYGQDLYRAIFDAAGEGDQAEESRRVAAA